MINLFSFQTSTNPSYQKVYSGLESDTSNLVATDMDGVAKASTEKFAYISDNIFFKFYLAQNHMCDLALIMENFFYVDFAFALPKNSPYKKHFDDG